MGDLKSWDCDVDTVVLQARRCKRSNHNCRSLPAPILIETQADRVRWAMAQLFWLCFSCAQDQKAERGTFLKSSFELSFQWGGASTAPDSKAGQYGSLAFFNLRKKSKDNLVVLHRNGGDWFLPWCLQVFPWNEGCNDLATMLSPIMTSASSWWLSRKAQTSQTFNLTLWKRWFRC